MGQRNVKVSCTCTVVSVTGDLQAPVDIFFAMNHIEDSTQASLANLLMSRELSPEEYFNIALSSCSADLTTVQAAVATVISRLDDEDARKTQLKTLYNQV